MAKKKTIAIDIDDVISETNDSVRQWVNSFTGANLKPQDYKVPGEYWGYYERVWEQNGIGDKIVYKNIDDAVTNDEVTIPILPGAAYAIKQLKDRFNVILVTSRNPLHEDYTRRWVDEHLGDEIEIYFARNGRLGVGISKGEICKKLGAFILIDDNIEHCVSALENGIEAVAFGNYGWHMELESIEGLVHCEDWPKVLEHFDGYEE